MKLFKDSRGFIFAFGWDMLRRVENQNMICWCDPATKEWEASSSNNAGCVTLGYEVRPEFIIESNDHIIAYQPGKCIILAYEGGHYVWNIETLRADS